MQNLGMKWLCGLMLLWGSHLFGQSAYHDDLITLKNGSVLRGHIISQSTDEGLLLRTLDGQEISFSGDQIERIERRSAIYRRFSPKYEWGRKPNLTLPPGPYWGLAFSLGASTDGASPALDFHLSYRWHSWLQGGMGVGLHSYAGGLIVPVFGQLSGSLTRWRVAPFYQLQAGYGLPTSFSSWRVLEFRGGLMVHPALGIRWKTTRGRHLVLSLGYRGQDSFERYQEFFRDDRGNQRIIEVSGNRFYQRWVLQLAFFP